MCAVAQLVWPEAKFWGQRSMPLAFDPVMDLRVPTFGHFTLRLVISGRRGIVSSGSPITRCPASGIPRTDSASVMQRPPSLDDHWGRRGIVGLTVSGAQAALGTNSSQQL